MCDHLKGVFSPLFNVAKVPAMNGWARGRVTELFVKPTQAWHSDMMLRFIAPPTVPTGLQYPDDAVAH